MVNEIVMMVRMNLHRAQSESVERIAYFSAKTSTVRPQHKFAMVKMIVEIIPMNNIAISHVPN